MDQTARLGERTAADVIGLYGNVGDVLTFQDFLDTAPVMIARANLAGTHLAQAAANTLLVSAGQSTVTAAGLTVLDHALDLARLSRAVDTCLEAVETAEARLQRLAAAEPVETTQRAFGGLLDTTEAVEGWTRSLEPDACQLCQWWAREGRVWPTGHSMPTHKGCQCTQRPVLTEKVVTPVSRDAQRASEKREVFGSLDDRRLVDPSAYMKPRRRTS